MVRIALFDFGAGNLFSLQHSLKKNGAEKVATVTTLKELRDYDGLVLPGVGNFDSAIRSIKTDIEFFKEAVDRNMPILGICLGLEMLFNSSEEGTLDGLCILDGSVLMLPKKKVKVPHMGWNNIDIIKNSKLLQGIPTGSWLYFVHSYHINPVDKNVITATAEYGDELPAAIEKSNLFGTQFHPEKSGKTGAQIIKNFLDICTDNK